MPAFELTPGSAPAYFRERGVVPATGSIETRRLGGGVSNRVVQLRWGEGCLVAKQPRPDLAVEEHWPADVERVHNEAAAIRAFEGVLAEGTVDARVPAVRDEDREEHVIAIECAPEDAEMWKRALLDRRVDRSIGRRCGELLGTVHAALAGDDDVRSAFADDRPFEQLRLDPYHRTVAERHPDVAAHVRDEIDRIEGAARTLVHGDYSPKNVLVASDGNASVWLLDFEVAHWGDPAFDVAFMCNHLFIKSVYNADRTADYRATARLFWDAYRKRVPWDVEAAVVRELAVLMLARVDGKSPVEYLEDEAQAETLRRIAKTAMTEGVETFGTFEDLVAGEVSA